MIGTRTQKSEKITVEKIFAILITIFASITFVIQPLFSVPDEGTHYANAYGIFHNDTKNDNYFAAYRYPNNIDFYRDHKFAKSYTEKGDYTQDKLALNFTSTSVQYLPAAVGMLLGQWIYPSTGVILSFGRLFNLIFYALAIYFAIKKAKFGQWMMAAVALLPMSVQQAVSVSYDVFFFVTVFLTFSLVTNLVTRQDRLKWRDYLPIILVICLLFLAKQSSLVMLFYFLALPVSLVRPNFFTSAIDSIWNFFNRYRLIFLVLMALSFLLFIQYYFKNYEGLTRGLQVLFNTFFRPDIKTDLDEILVTGVIGNFGWLTHRLPEWFVILDFIFLFLILLNEKPVKLQNRFVFMSSMIFIGNILMVSLTMFSAWTIGVLKLFDIMFVSGEQGRYYTPFLICLIPLGIYLKKYITVKMSDLVMKRLFVGMLLANFAYFVILTLLFYYTDDGGSQFITQFSSWIRGLI